MRQGEGDAPGSASAMPMKTRKSSLCPPIELLRFDEALHLMSPPIEAGEHCHVCNRSAICLDYHAAWCRRCVTALLRERGIRTMGENPKETATEHANEHAHRWERLACRLLESPLIWPTLQDANFAQKKTDPLRRKKHNFVYAIGWKKE